MPKTSRPYWRMPTPHGDKQAFLKTFIKRIEIHGNEIIRYTLPMPPHINPSGKILASLGIQSDVPPEPKVAVTPKP